MSEDKPMTQLELFTEQEAQFCEELIHQSHVLETEAKRAVVDLQEIIDNLQRLLGDAFRLREIKKML